MQPTKQPQFKLIGLNLGRKTTNENEQAGIDCGSLWQRFETEGIYVKIPNKLTEEVIAVYFDYDGDHTQPYSYFIGCKVSEDTQTPEGLDSLIIPEQDYQKIVAKGQMPNCVADAWRSIWKSGIERPYTYDFEIYGSRSHDWSNAEVDIFLAVK